MDLWIRSQDREILKKVNQLYVTTYNDELGYGIYDINHEDLDDCDISLGFYKTKERALEVLDEIQSKLISNKIIMQLNRNVHIREEDAEIFCNKYDIKLLPTCAELKSIPNDILIYEMPE